MMSKTRQKLQRADIIVFNQLLKMMRLLQQKQSLTKMSLSTKQSRDQEFKPKEIKVRATYRKVRTQIKDQMAKLYYVENLKMSKIVKKFKISYSTLADILKKYTSFAERLDYKIQKKIGEKDESLGSQSQKGQKEELVKVEAQLEQAPVTFPSFGNDDDTPHYIYYGR